MKNSNTNLSSDIILVLFDIYERQVEQQIDLNHKYETTDFAFMSKTLIKFRKNVMEDPSVKAYLIQNEPVGPSSGSTSDESWMDTPLNNGIREITVSDIYRP